MSSHQETNIGRLNAQRISFIFYVAFSAANELAQGFRNVADAAFVPSFNPCALIVFAEKRGRQLDRQTHTEEWGGV